MRPGAPDRRWRAPAPDRHGGALPEPAPRIADWLEPGARIALAGAAGSGRRAVALGAAALTEARWPAGAWLAPALASRLPRVLRRLGEAAGVTVPAGLSASALRTVWHGVAGAPGLLIVDARLGGDPAVLAALEPPPSWARIALIAAERGGRGERALRLPGRGHPAAIDDGLHDPWHALGLGDPWAGLARDDLAVIADGDPDAALAALAAARRAHRLDDGRVAPVVHDAIHAAGRASPAMRRRFVEVMAAHAGVAAARDREHDNLIAALGLVRRGGPRSAHLGARFLPAVEAWIAEPATRSAAGFVLDAAALCAHEPAEVRRLRARLERAV